MHKTLKIIVIQVLCFSLSLPAHALPAENKTRGEASVDTAYLKRVERATFQGFKALTDPVTGFALDIAPVSQGKVLRLKRSTKYSKTSPLHIALSFLYVILARDLGYMDAETARRQAFNMMETVEGLETHENFLYSWYYLPGEEDKWPRVTTNRFVPSLENSYLDAALMAVWSAIPDKGLAGMIEDFLARRDYSFFYMNGETAPAVSRGYDVQLKAYSPEDYRILNHAARLTLLLAVVKGDLPKTVWTRQERLTKEYETVRGSTFPVLISWTGSLYDVLFADEFLDGYRIAPAAFGINALNSLRAHKDRGRRLSSTGIWGFSEGELPDQNLYSEGGVPEIAYKRGDSRFATPYSSFLALGYLAPEAVENMKAMEKLNPAVFGTRYGFADSIDPQTGVVNRNLLGIHKGIEVLALGNFMNRRNGFEGISSYFWNYLKAHGMEKPAMALIKGEEKQPAYAKLQAGAIQVAAQEGDPARVIDLMKDYRDIGTFYDPEQSKAWHRVFSLAEGNKIFGIRYDVRRKYTYSGFYMKLRQTDLSRYRRLNFDVMGSREKGFPENIKVELKWKGQNVQFDYIALKDRWTRIELLLPPGAKSVDEIAFVFDNAEVGTARRGEVFIQSLSFN
mgnify:CR=1 FL=1